MSNSKRASRTCALAALLSSSTLTQSFGEMSVQDHCYICWFHFRMNFVLYLIKCNVDKQKLLTCIHIVSNNKKKNILFFFIIITNYAYVHEFHSSKIKEKVFLYMYIIHIHVHVFNKIEEMPFTVQILWLCTILIFFCNQTIFLE